MGLCWSGSSSSESLVRSKINISILLATSESLVRSTSAEEGALDLDESIILSTLPLASRRSCSTVFTRLSTGFLLRKSPFSQSNPYMSDNGTKRPSSSLRILNAASPAVLNIHSSSSMLFSPHIVSRARVLLPAPTDSVPPSNVADKPRHRIRAWYAPQYMSCVAKHVGTSIGSSFHVPSASWNRLFCTNLSPTANTSTTQLKQSTSMIFVSAASTLPFHTTRNVLMCMPWTVHSATLVRSPEKAIAWASLRASIKQLFFARFMEWTPRRMLRGEMFGKMWWSDSGFMRRDLQFPKASALIYTSRCIARNHEKHMAPPVL